MANKKIILYDVNDNSSELYPKTTTEQVSGLSTALGNKQDTLISGTNIKTINSTSLLGEGNIDISGGGASVVSTTYSALKTLRDNSQLVAGQWYRITDYRTYATGTSVTCANHDFDLLVFATTPNELSEQAKATLHSGDTYFASSNLNAWKVWYCLDNDSTRFAWADTTNGKGVIYRLIDERNNDVPYDFKNILYSTKYVFSCLPNGGSNWIDASLKINCHNNTIKPRYNFQTDNKQLLNHNIFSASSTSSDYQGNFLEEGCYLNTFSYSCKNNHLERLCNNNSFGSSCEYNLVRTGSSSCTIGYNSKYNVIGISCYLIRIGNYSLSNIIGDDTEYITFGSGDTKIDYVRNVVVDNGCKYLNINNSSGGSSSNYLQNIHVKLGVVGSSSSNRLTLSPSRNLDYETTYTMTGSTEVIL